ncbi:hypothetical protein D0469_19170 [Peribacillus saganii]|uniref:Uncharacterized protein n=1 Tax=Peribacillus saganii TaxID=2303992 RepID=A0A372LDQ7_9BACI|nr:hypothetical protein D0469_19170 [Peribacillus saganii]
MRNVDIYQCDHILTNQPIFVIGWLVGDGSFSLWSLILSFQVIIPQLLNIYRKVNHYENLRKQEKT